MKVKKIKPTGYKIRIEMTDKEAIELIKDIGEYKQGEIRGKHSATSKIFMVLVDTLQDLDLIPMTPNRKKGDRSYPRLTHDKVWVDEVRLTNKSSKEVKKNEN